MARGLGAADRSAARPALAPTRTGPGPQRSLGGGFHVEHGDHAAADPAGGAPQPPLADPEALAWRWRRGQLESRPLSPPTDGNQAVTVRPVAAPVTEDASRHDEPPLPRARPSAPREELERARHLATGAWQPPPEGGGPWARVAEELRHP